jgi:hypothetical protein
LGNGENAMMLKKIIIDIPFNIDLGALYLSEPYVKRMYDKVFKNAQTKEWIDYRIDIFMQYTYMSLKAQIDQSFVCLMRYNEPTKALIDDALARYPQLPDNIIFTYEADKIIEEVMQNYDYLYHVRIDSDNMYHFDFIQQVNKFPYEEGLECLLCKDGYIYDVSTDRLGQIYHESPSLYVYIYDKETYRDHFKSRLFENHFKAVQLKHKVMYGKNYMIIVHKKNVDNEFDFILRHCRGQRIEDEATKTSILEKWQIKRI